MPFFAPATRYVPMSTAYHQLCQIASEIALLESLVAIVDWDQETYMPADAISHRAKQQSYLTGKGHALFTSKHFLKLLDQAEGEDLTPLARANVVVLRRQTDRAIKLPLQLVEQMSEASSTAKAAWVQARKDKDFAAFRPHLEALLGLLQQKAERWGYDAEPYDALLEEYEPGARAAAVAAQFEVLRPQLSLIANEAVARSADVPADLLDGDYPVALQQQLNREIAESIGFDFEAGRIDTTTHPFCTKLGPRDIRLTTRYDSRDFTSSLFGVLHETGHGLYEQGLPVADYGLPSGVAASLGLHESQSRLWENHVGRSRPFWERWWPRAVELFPHLKRLSLEDFMRFVQRSEFSFIRVEADEATYDLHILLRFGLERQMMSGKLAVKDLPEAWNAEFQRSFGMTPPDDSQGCLQDIHWAMGGMGYFPTYTLGNLNAAQLFNAAEQQPAIAEGNATASYAPLLHWLRHEVHQHGSAQLPKDIMKTATGSDTDARWHLQHLRSRFLGRVHA